MLVLSSQRQLLASAPAVFWFTDAASVVGFVGGHPPENSRRLQRWWFYLTTFPLSVKHIPGAFKEYADFLSRSYTHAFPFKFGGITMEEMAAASFNTLDEAIDLAIVPKT